MKCLSKFHAIGAGIETRIMTCGGPTTHEEFILSSFRFETLNTGPI